jgi:anti-sigma factor RsiW
MNCDKVLDELPDYIDERCGPIRRIRLRRHLARCEACAEALREDEVLNERLAVLEDEAPPEAVWLRIRDVVSASGLSDTIRPTLWERMRAGTLRYAMPYALGVATTALLLMVGLGRPDTPVAPVGQPGGADGSGVAAVDDDVPLSRPAPEWITSVDQPGALREGEMPLVVEDRRELVIRRRQDKDIRRINESLRERGVNPADVVPATPVSFGKKTH